MPLFRGPKTGFFEVFRVLEQGFQKSSKSHQKVPKTQKICQKHDFHFVTEFPVEWRIFPPVGHPFQTHRGVYISKKKAGFSLKGY